MKLKNSHLLNAQELASLGIGESSEEQLKWFLSFVNQGVWKRERRGPGLDSLSFAGGLRATHDAYGKLEKEILTFCGYNNSQKPFTRNDLVKLQSIGASMLVAIAKNGVFAHKISECTLVLFTDGRERKSRGRSCST